MSLQPDTRQRAMLAEMGVKVWLPTAKKKSVPDVIETVAKPAPVNRPIAQPTVETVAKLPTVQRSLPNGLDAMNWIELQQAVSTCAACDLCEGRVNTVFGSKNFTVSNDNSSVARWLIVGEHPDDKEEFESQAFVGPAGELLDNMLKAIGLQRASNASEQIWKPQVFVTHAIKCKPSNHRKPTKPEINTCHAHLKRQIELIKPRVILAMGQSAIHTLLKDSVTEIEKMVLGKLRGEVYHYQGIPVVVTYLPSYLLTSASEKSKAWRDLCLALRVASGPQNAGG
ncbi:MAG: uracil-DNA glycosylase [Limnohabitans sp.]|nr:uracil-DNA glycosylase [Limnohabitans sp.]